MPLFTRVTLNPVNPDVRKVLRSPEAIHAVVSAATSGSSRPLWRLDGDRLYIVSDQLDTDRLEARLGKPIINTLDYRPFLDKLQNGETRRFTLTATPVVSKNGKRTPLRTPAGMHQWAGRQAHPGRSPFGCVGYSRRSRHPIQPSGPQTYVPHCRIHGRDHYHRP